MAQAGGIALRTVLTIVYILTFLSSILVAGVYTYFLVRLATNSLHINPKWEAVEGISGGGFIFSIFAVLLTCFLGGTSFFAFVAVLIDIVLAGGFIAIAIFAQDGVKGCSGFVHTPLGDGPADVNSPLYGQDGFGLNATRAYAPNLKTACTLNTSAFAGAVAGGFFFLLAALVQILVNRSHRRNKKNRDSASSAEGLLGNHKEGYFEPNTNTTHDSTLDTTEHHPVPPPPMKRTLRPDSYQKARSTNSVAMENSGGVNEYDVRHGYGV